MSLRYRRIDAQTSVQLPAVTSRGVAGVPVYVPALRLIRRVVPRILVTSPRAMHRF